MPRIGCGNVRAKHLLVSALLVVVWAGHLAVPAQAQLGQGIAGGPADALKGPEEISFQDRVLEEGGPRYGPSSPQPPVADVQIMGRESVPEHEIWSRLRTRRGRQFDPATLEADVRKLYDSKLFQHIQTRQQLLPEGMLIIFEVYERPTIRYVKYVGNRGLADRTLARQSGLKEGDALNRFAVMEARRKVEEFYQSKGYPDTLVSVLEGDEPQDRGVVLFINEGQLERIDSVDFEGNTFANDGRLKTLIESKPTLLKYTPFGGKVDSRKIEEDVERLTTYYRSFGFFRARVGREMKYDDSGKWLRLTFVIDEGPRYRIRNVNVVGNEKFASVDLLNQLNLRTGDYFNLSTMTADRNSLADHYGSKGHVFADIQAEPRYLEEPGELDLVYNIKEGDVFRIGKINVHIEGDHPHTRHNVVLNRISQQPGDIIDIREIRASERRLMAAQVFRHDPSQGVSPSIVFDPSGVPQDAGSVADKPGSTNGTGVFRGQSPDAPYAR